MYKVIKGVASIVLVLGILLQLWGCGTAPADNSSNSQDSTISALQNEVSRLLNENELGKPTAKMGI